MRISYNWLKEYVDIELTVQQVSDKLTMAGLEVEGLEYLGEGIEGVVVGKILSIKPHPDADKLTVCEVDTGAEALTIVCGAKNMKEGDKVPLAVAGARLPGGIKISKGKLRGVVSHGMLCSEKELGLAKDAHGLMILPDELPVGESIVKAIGLDDWAMEINVTPNRPDCLSVIGIAREVAALTRRPMKMPEANLKETGKPIKELAKVEVEDVEACPRYAGRVITGVKVGPSPQWLQRKLHAVGIRSINNIVDVTNYVMIETGQPLHAFDYDLLQGRKIVVRTAAEGEAFTTLDGVERKLATGMLLICDGERPVALAGVMGGQNSEVSPATVSIFLESAYFNPGSVRRTAKKLGLHSEASHRFERGTDPEGVLAAADRAAGLISQLVGGAVATGMADEYPKAIVMPEVELRVSRVEMVLGAKLEKNEIEDIALRLQLSVKDTGEDTLMLQAPTFRPDLTREADIIEEVARVYGYAKIKTTLPSFVMTAVQPDRTRDASGSVRDALLCSGYDQVVNYSFINPREFDRLNLAEDDYRRKVVELQNPLTVEQSVMRSTIVPSLLNNLSWNFSRGVRELRIFEISKVFHSEGPGLPKEPLRVAALATGRRTGSLWDGQTVVDFFDIKGTVELLLGQMRIEGMFKPASDVPFLHPGKSAWVMVGGREAGYLGQVHPDVMKEYDLPLDAFVFELKLEDLIEVEADEVKFRQLPKYPAIERDIAAIVQEDVTSFNIIKAIESMKLDLMEDIRLFDHFSGSPIPEGRKSLAYTITYRSPERTLTDDEVNAQHQLVMNMLKERLGADIRER